MNGKQLRIAMFAGLSALSMALPAFAQDAGTPDKAAAEQAFPKRAYSPYTQRNFPARRTHL
jgi:hypothetical protein